MTRARAEIAVPGLASSAEDLWYDTARWPTFVDGLAHVDDVQGDWPHAGSRVVWTSRPGGRGRVVERVVRHEARGGQTVEVEDEQIRGMQTVTFLPGEQARVVLELEYVLKGGGALAPLAAFFSRRPQRDSLRRTLRRFAIELRDERAPL